MCKSTEFCEKNEILILPMRLLILPMRLLEKCE